MVRLELMWLRTKAKLQQGLKNMFTDETGAADIVAILVIIVIVLGVAVVFKEQLMKLVETVFNNATKWVESNTPN